MWRSIASVDELYLCGGGGGGGVSAVRGSVKDAPLSVMSSDADDVHVLVRLPTVDGCVGLVWTRAAGAFSMKVHLSF